MTQLRETLRISGLTLIGGGRNQSEVRDQKSEIAAHGSFVPAAVIHIALLTGGGDKPYALGIAAALTMLLMAIVYRRQHGLLSWLIGRHLSEIEAQPQGAHS